MIPIEPVDLEAVIRTLRDAGFSADEICDEAFEQEDEIELETGTVIPEVTIKEFRMEPEEQAWEYGTD
jgi:hypothetical protein